MSRAKRCDCSRLIDRHFAGHISARDERRLREHLTDCAGCQDYYRRHQLFAKLDSRSLPAEERLARGLGLGGPWAPIRRGLRALLSPGPMALVAAAAACFVVLLVRPVGSPSDFQPRGVAVAPPAQFWAYRVAGDQKPTELGDSIAPDEELAFAYFNPDENKRLLVFGVDEHRHVYWYYPAWLDPASSPEALPIRAGRHELPEAIAHALDGTELTLYAVITDDPVSVRRVEASILRGDGSFTQRATWSRRVRVAR